MRLLLPPYFHYTSLPSPFVRKKEIICWFSRNDRIIQWWRTPVSGELHRTTEIKKIFTHVGTQGMTIAHILISN